MIFTEYINLRDVTDDSKVTGVTVELLPVGSSYPSGAIALTANASIPHQYEFNGSVVNGSYYLYVDSVLQLRKIATAWVIRVIRGGIVSPEDTDFAVSV